MRERAEELVASGMPHQMALAVAHGRLPLNEALEKLARREQVNRLMERHDLSRALATQVALGQVELDLVLSRRRLAEHREAHRDRSILETHHESGEPVALLLHGRRRVTGQVIRIDPYSIHFQPEGGEAEDIHKLQVKVGFAPEAYKRLRKVLRTDRALEKAPREPIARPQDRYTVSDKRLFRYIDQELEIQATTLEGDLIRGQLTWFSRYELGMRIKGDVEVVIFRHALHDLDEV